MKKHPCSFDYGVYVSTVHPEGMPLVPVTSQVAVLFLTNVPVDLTPETHKFVYDVVGVVVKAALIYSIFVQPLNILL